MRVVSGRKGRTREGYNDGGADGSEQCGDRIVGIAFERGGEGTLSGDSKAGRYEGKEG